MSRGLIDNLLEALKNARNPGVVRHALGCPQAAACRRNAGRIPPHWCGARGGAFEGGETFFQARCWMGAATDRPYAPMAPRH
jgi:hypothetical protein